MSSPTTPLLNKPSSSSTVPLTSTPPHPFARPALLTLGMLRGIFGAAVLFAPVPILGLMGVDLPPHLAFLGSIIGARDFILGELMLLSDPKIAGLLGCRSRAQEEGRGLLGARRAVWASVAADSFDAVVLALALGRGDIGEKAAWMGVGGALVFAFAGMDVLWLLK